jgi:hypothetical protein
MEKEMRVSIQLSFGRFGSTGPKSIPHLGEILVESGKNCAESPAGLIVASSKNLKLNAPKRIVA